MSKPPMMWYVVSYALMALIAFPLILWYPQLIVLPVISMFVAFLCYRPVRWMENPFIGPWRPPLIPWYRYTDEGKLRFAWRPLIRKRHDLPFRMSRGLFGAIMVFGTLAFLLTVISYGLTQTVSDLLGLQPKLEMYWPQFVAYFNTDLHPLLKEYGGIDVTLNADIVKMLSQLSFLKEYAGDGINLLTTLANIATALAMTVAHLVMEMFIIAFVAYYMLLKWEDFNAGILRTFHRFTPDVADKYVTKLLKRISKSYVELFQGQFTVCFIMALYYAFALTIAGLPLGFLIGFVAGLLCIFPLAGMTLGGLVSLVVTAFELQLSQGWEPYITTLLIFGGGFAIEGKFLAPHIIGRKLHLSDAWVYLGLFAGEVMGGFVGMLLVLPIISLLNQIIITVVEAWDQRFKPEVWRYRMERWNRIYGKRTTPSKPRAS